MKRNWNIVRDILLSYESGDDALLSGYDATDVAYNQALLLDAGHLDYDADAAAKPLPGQMTWSGSDLLDEIRDGEVWSHVRNAIDALDGLPSSMVVERCRKARWGGN